MNSSQLAASGAAGVGELSGVGFSGGVMSGTLLSIARTSAPI